MKAQEVGPRTLNISSPKNDLHAKRISLVIQEDRLKIGEEGMGDQLDSPNEFKDKAQMSAVLLLYMIVAPLLGVF